MTDHSFSINPNAVSMRRIPPNADAHNTVRAYRSSPDRVTLQICAGRSFATATIPFDTARAIAAALVQESQYRPAEATP